MLVFVLFYILHNICMSIASCFPNMYHHEQLQDYTLNGTSVARKVNSFFINGVCIACGRE